jgi:hypothetical protein
MLGRSVPPGRFGLRDEYETVQKGARIRTRELRSAPGSVNTLGTTVSA